MPGTAKLLNKCLVKLNEPVPDLLAIQKRKSKLKIRRKSLLNALEIDNA